MAGAGWQPAAANLSSSSTAHQHKHTNAKQHNHNHTHAIQYWVTLLLNGAANSLTCYQLAPDWWRGGPRTGSAGGGGDDEDGSGDDSGGALPAGGLQLWVDRRGTGWRRLPWRAPEAAHVAAAAALVDKYLARGAADLEALVCGSGGGAGNGGGGNAGGGGGNGADAVAFKQRAQALLAGLSAILMGLMGRLEDWQGLPSPSAAAVPLHPVGRTGAPVGRPGARDAAAASLARVIAALRRDGGDRDLLEQALAAAMVLASPGMLEQQLGGQRSHTGKGDSGVTEEPAAATALLLSGARAAAASAAADALGPAAACEEEPRWRKRSSFMSAVERVKRMLLWRASAAAARGHQADGRPEVGDLLAVPLPLRALLAEAVAASLLPYATARATAAAAAQAALRRFPCLARAVLPTYLGAIAGAPPPAAASAAALLLATSAAEVAEGERAVADYYEVTLRAASVQRDQPSSGAGAAGGGGNGAGGAGVGAGASAAAEESANDGRVAGACAALTGSIELLRFAFRDPPAWRALVRAALASRVHGSSACEDALGMLLMQIAARFKLPPPLGDCPAGPELAALLADLAALGQPGGAARAALRYCVAANVVVLLASPLAPPAPAHRADAAAVDAADATADAAAGADSAAALSLAAARHFGSLLTCDMLLLRNVGALGLSLQIIAALERGGATRAALAAYAEARLAEPGFGEALVGALALGHARLDQVEAAKGQRGGAAGGGSSVAALMSMGFEELLWFTVSSLLDRGIRWRAGAPAVREGLFEPAAARLVHLLAALAPAATLRALEAPLRARLAAHMQPAGPTDKAEHAAVAEAAAGLLAAAAPFAAAGGGGDGGNDAMDVDGGNGGGAAVAGGSSNGGWLLALVRDALAGCTLEMAASWAAAARYALGHLMPPAALADALPDAPPAAAARRGAAGRARFGAPGAPPEAAARCLRALLGALLRAPGGGSSGGAAGGSGIGGGGGGAAGAPLLREMRRLRLFEQAVAAVRAFEPGCPPEGASSGGGGGGANGDGGSGAVCFAASAGWRADAGADGALPRSAFVGFFRPPKEARAFVAGVAAEVALLLDAGEQPGAVQEAAGRLLADLAALLAPAAVAPAGGAGDGGAIGDARGAEPGSGASSPVELDAASRGSGGGAGNGSGGGASASNGDDEPLVVVLNPSASALAAQLAALLDRTARRFEAECDALSALKGPGEAARGGGGGGNGGNGGGSSGGGAAVDDDGDAVLVQAPAAAAAAAQQPAAMATELSEARVRAAASAAGVGLHFLLAAAYGPDAAALRPLALRGLRPLLALQMLSAPGLQRLAVDAKRAAVAFKYLPVAPGAECELAVAAIAAAGASPHWTTRAAAVVHLCCFWFRHCFVLPPGAGGAAGGGAGALEALVVALLRDPKAEVRAVAAATLSGMVRGMPPRDARALRERLVAEARALFGPGPAGGRAKRRAPGAQQAAPEAPSAAADAAARQHACVQGLNALVMSAPYDLPLWMPPVLMALAAAAGAPAAGAQVRRAAAKALSEFRRTHESVRAFCFCDDGRPPRGGGQRRWALSDLIALPSLDHTPQTAQLTTPLQPHRQRNDQQQQTTRDKQQDALDELRALLAEDEWDALLAIASPATYIT